MEKTFIKVTSPKSRMSTNSITGAYLVLGERATNGTAKPFTKVTAPKSSESTISTIPAYMRDSVFCRYFAVL